MKSEITPDCRRQNLTMRMSMIFPQLVVQQIGNSLAARQILPKGPSSFELIFHFFGYADDTAEMRLNRVKQANLVGPAGLVSLEDGFATELVQRGSNGSNDALSIADMGRGESDDDRTRSGVTESYVRSFRRRYSELMGL